MGRHSIDVLASFLGLVVLLPVFILVAIAIKIDSPGQIFYLQERTGRWGIPFRLWKFRTMQVMSDKKQIITIGKKDARITRVGTFLRRFKLDELPQLMNVVKGEMSLVGPRPELKAFTDLYTTEQKTVLSVRPGITDPASIYFRNENEMLEGKEDPIAYYIAEIMPLKLSLNLRYLEDRSALKDIRVIFVTIGAIFRRG